MGKTVHRNFFFEICKHNMYMDKGTGFGEVESVSGIFELVVRGCRGEVELVEGMASSRLGLILRSLTPSTLAWVSGGAFVQFYLSEKIFNI